MMTFSNDTIDAPGKTKKMKQPRGRSRSRIDNVAISVNTVNDGMDLSRAAQIALDIR